MPPSSPRRTERLATGSSSKESRVTGRPNSQTLPETPTRRTALDDVSGARRHHRNTRIHLRPTARREGPLYGASWPSTVSGTLHLPPWAATSRGLSASSAT